MLLIPMIDKIEKRKLELNYSNLEIAKIAGLPKNSIGRILRSECKKTHPLRAREIARALECQVEDIFYVSEMKKEG